MSEIEPLHERVQALIAPAQRGDREAVGRLAGACRERVFRWALTKLGDPDDADDVTQEVLMRLERTISQYRGDARFTTWLYRLTSNVAIDLQRGRNRRAKLAEWEAVRSPSAVSADHLADIHAADVVRLVRAFFSQLPDRQREIFDLVDLQGHTPAEVSDMLNMNGATVRAHLLKARRAIRRRILIAVPTLAEELTP